MSLEIQLKSLNDDLQGMIEKQKELSETGSQHTETFKTLSADIKSAVSRLDELDLKMVQSPGSRSTKTFRAHLEEQDGFHKASKGERGKFHIKITPEMRAMAEMEAKTVTSSIIGFQTPGVMPAERGGYVQEARPDLSMRDALPTRGTMAQHIYWPKASNVGTKASPVAEAALKPDQEYDPTVVETRVKTIATRYKVARQTMEDYGEMEGILRNLLAFKVRKEEDRQLLFGDNTGENLNGVTTQAQAWDLALLTASDGYEYVDILGGACQQIAEDDELTPTFAVVHPREWWKIKRQKDSQGRYILGDPASPFNSSVWGLRVIPTTQMTQGYFLVGTGSPEGSEIRDRMGLEVLLSTEDGDNFSYNLVTIRAESRLAYACYRPNAFVYGAFTQSPA